MPIIKKITFTILLLSGLLCITHQTHAQVPEEIILSLQTGNSKVLSEYFNQNVELVVLENDNVYSKAQAKQIVSNFFNANTPEPQGFTILHQGGKEGAKYLIGNLKTNNGSFRVYFLLKKNGSKEYIHQLRIEKK